MEVENREFSFHIEELNQQYYGLQVDIKELEEQLNLSDYKSFHLQTENDKLNQEKKNFVSRIKQLNQELSNVKNQLSKLQQPKSGNSKGKKDMWGI